MKKPSLQLSKSKPRMPKRNKGANRVGDLAVLPVFLNLKGKQVLLAGGSDAAAWKGELLAASGAQVHVYAQELDEAFHVVRQAHPNSFIVHQRPWATDAFDLMQVAIGDCESEGEAKAFYCAAKAAGVPVNVIDKPAFCEFQFGSIVNRSPTIVSISTNGAAPIFGQAIRRKIETLLPASVQDWAKLAAKIRGSVNERLGEGKERRAFWERFVDRAFSSKVDETTTTDLFNDIEKVHHDQCSTTGHVTLVGAGPGDAELLTLKAVRALQSADVIVFDDLVSDEVLELSRREAKRMHVGKRGGRTSCKQEDINDMMVSLAKAGKHVVRLKSGDPVIFGRAGEEIDRLHNEGISVAIVPGVTSASAMAAKLGISLTHRNQAQSVRYITGHSKNGILPNDVNWRAIADPTTSTIFYMGGRTAGEIQSRLLAEGMPGDYPVVICASVSRPEQKNWFGSLSSLEKGIEEIGYKNPVLIGIGAVFAKAQIQPKDIDIAV